VVVGSQIQLNTNLELLKLHNVHATVARWCRYVYAMPSRPQNKNLIISEYSRMMCTMHGVYLQSHDLQSASLDLARPAY
jgi:hypothetical protein